MLLFLHSVNAVYILDLVILCLSLPLPLSLFLPASSAVSQGGSVAPGQTYASFHCTNPNAAWRNNCSSGRGFAGALSLTGSRQPDTRHFNQLSLSLSLYISNLRPFIKPDPHASHAEPHPCLLRTVLLFLLLMFFFIIIFLNSYSCCCCCCCCQVIIFGAPSSLMLTVQHGGSLYWQNGGVSNDYT